MSETATGATGAWSYRTGDWFAVFGANATVLLPASQKDQVVALWALVDGGAGFDEVLDGLLASGLSRIPGFVLVSDDDGPTRVLLRGQGVTATLATADEEVTLDGAASHTWVERSVDGVLALSVSVPADEEAGRGEADFPIATGLVRIGQVDRPAVVPVSGGAHAAAPAVDGPDDAAAGAEAEPEAAPVLDLGKPAPADAMVEAPTDESTDEPVEDAVVDDVAVDDEPAPAEPEVMAEAAMAEADAMVEDEPSPLDEGPATEVMDVVPDPLSDPLPPPPGAPAPDGWVTPWDSSPTPSTGGAEEPAEEPVEEPVEEPAGEAASADPLAEPDTPAVPSPPLPPMGGETEVAPVGWVPPPPPSVDAPVDAPPLGIGSWEPVGGTPPPPPVPAPFDPDHDGQTVTGVGPDVPSPPQPGIPGQPPAPAVTQPVAKLLISDGQTVVVDRAVLIGRAPEARRFTSTEQPMLVTVPSRLHEISSTHVEVRPGTGADHGTAVVTDMGSTNGTVLVQPGLGPEDLKPGIAVQLIPGAIINLGDGITIQVTRP
ncbi:hypothetical protein BJ993_001034 [Nocardioides aromaticivorans]|uniref:FHA domain-containing protein n=1 Tax=Nocardioides aromaticivorans TaxID=200618 RepID=A0A7Y9ZEI6_9ACTN|nr:hypothetical protein [Nocardioides aromaticivorans]NYI43954.1 hypothetical protein [Nocardioides aromaticivorans]